MKQSEWLSDESRRVYERMQLWKDDGVIHTYRALPVILTLLELVDAQAEALSFYRQRSSVPFVEIIAAYESKGSTFDILNQYCSKADEALHVFA